MNHPRLIPQFATTARFALLAGLMAVSPAASTDSAAGPALACLRQSLTVPGVVLIDHEDASGLTTSMEEASSSGIVALEDGAAPPAGTALRVRVAKSYQPVYRIQAFSSQTAAVVRKGETLIVGFWVRATESPAGTDGVVSMRLQLNREPWASPVVAEIGCDAQWKPVFASGVADRDYAAGSLQVVFHLGQQQQVIDLAGVVVLNLGLGADLANLPRTRITWPGMAADAAWREEAARRIKRHRMADLVVRVTDASGKPAAGVPVRVRQQRRAFTVGSFVQFSNPTRLLAASPDGDHTREMFTRLFNRATCPIYWADWGWPGRKDEFLEIGGWLRQHDLTVRGHVMIYPGFKFMPAEVLRLQSDPGQLRERVLQQVREVSVATRFLGFREYDVTNELRDCVDLHRICGREVVVDWFAEARRLLPGAKLALNENTILTNCGATEANQDLYLDWYRYLKSRGQAPDVLGFQGHFGEAFTPVETVWRILDRFARETDAELQITEFDINTLDEEAQAAYTRDFMTACFAHPKITGFTMWGFWEGDHWLPKAAGWRKDWTPKPNGRVIEELLTQTWWTDTEATTDADGRATVKAFLGTHQVTATRPGGDLRATAELTEPGGATLLEMRP